MMSYKAALGIGNIVGLVKHMNISRRSPIP